MLFQIPTPFGTFPVSSFGIFLLLAFIAAILETRTRTRRLGWDPGEVVDLSLYAIIGGIVGARLGYVLVNLRDFAAAPMRGFMIWVDAGLTFYGALLGGTLVAWVYGRKRNWRLLQIDHGVTIAQDFFSVMRSTFTLQRLLVLQRARKGEQNLPPLLSCRDLLEFATIEGARCANLESKVGTLTPGKEADIVLLAADRIPRPPGRLFWLFVLLMAVARIGIDVFMDSPHVLDGLTLAQVAGFLAGALAVVMLLMGGRSVPAGQAAAGSGPPAEPIAPPSAGGSHG